MGATENIDVVRRGYAAFVAGDMESLVAMFKPDVVHSVPGTSAIAGDHKGTQEVLSLYGSLASLSDGTVRVELEEVLSDGGNRVISIHTATATRKGVTRTVREALLFTIDDGKVASIQDFFGDIEADSQFWS
jgi:ketosteroid isomerase-like protein